MSPRPRGRVVASHTLPRRALAAAGVFGVVALSWAGVVLVRGGSWWGPLHAFVAGTVLLAISGASLMFTATWSATSPPPARLTETQRWLIAGGVAAVLAGRTIGVAALVWVGGVAVVGGLALLGAAIATTVRGSLLRRFDLSARFYLLALCCGLVGVTLGTVIGAGHGGARYTDWRLVHGHLNLVGLVGFTIVGTLPTFLPTVAHHRSVSGREAVVAWWLCLGAAAGMAGGAALGPPWVGAGSVLAGVGAAVVLGGILARLRAKGMRRLPFLQISAGVVWLVAWAIFDGAALLTGRPAAPFAGATGAAVVAGVGQVLLGSLAYLVPVLKGPPLGDNFSRMAARPAIPLALANLGGLGLALGFAWAWIPLGLWAVDFLRRLGAVLHLPPLGGVRRP